MSQTENIAASAANSATTATSATAANSATAAKYLNHYSYRPPSTPVSYWGYDAIQIGCKKYTISEWQKHFREIGKAEGYSEEQIDEYGSYIDLIAKLHGRWNIKQK